MGLSVGIVMIVQNRHHVKENGLEVKETVADAVGPADCKHGSMEAAQKQIEELVARLEGAKKTC